MKRIVIITLALLAMALGGITLWRLTGPHGVGDLYRQYADQPGVRVGYIKDYPFDECVKIDVTTVEALDSAGWAWMLDEFNLPTTNHPQPATNSITTLQLDDGRFLFFSSSEQKLCLVDARTDRQYDAVLRHHLKTLTK